jgi:hypothetical protein
MSILDENLAEFQNFPEPLRKLVEEELRAGNQVLEFGHGFPAAPCGAYIVLASPVSTRPRESNNELTFYDRNANNYSGEFTDAKRHFFVLEPPHPPQPTPDMQAIRAKIDAEYAANEALQARPYAFATDEDNSVTADSRGCNDFLLNEDISTSLVHNFVRSMEINYEKWREGEGYDLALLHQANDSERKAIERILIHHTPCGWRDIQALALLNSPTARTAIMDAFLHADTETRMAVHTYAPDLITPQLRTDSLVRGLREGQIFSGLSQTLREVEQFHPPEVIQELLRGLMRRDGGTACHFAAMLFFLHGKSASSFDWEHRPFFLKFNTDNLSDRATVVRELSEVIGVDPAVCFSSTCGEK